MDRRGARRAHRCREPAGTGDDVHRHAAARALDDERRRSMRAATMVAGLALALDLGAPPIAAGQARAGDLVAAARAQLHAGNVDSGLVLIGLALDSTTIATGRDRVNALVWRGVFQFFKGKDSLARESFRDGDRRERRCGHDHGWDRAGAIRGRHRRAGRAGVDRRRVLAQPGAAGSPARPRPARALLSGPGAGPRRAGLDAMAPHPAESVKSTPHPAVIVL